MGIYFDVKTISELLKDDCNFYRKEKQFTLDDLSQCNGKNGKPTYVAIEGIIYDVSNEANFNDMENTEIVAGKDLTKLFTFYYKMSQIINKAPRIGVLDDNTDMERENNMVRNNQEKQNSFEFRHNNWSHCIEPLVKCNKDKENKKKCKCQECIMSDALSGLEKILQETVKQLEELQTQLLEYPGTTTGTGIVSEGFGITEGTAAKSSIGASTVGIGILGGAKGGAGGGFGTENLNIETSSSSEMKGGAPQKNLGPGAIGGAAGGALGNVSREEE